MQRLTYGVRTQDPGDHDDPAARAAIERTPAFRDFAAGLRHIDDALRASPDPYANAVGIWLNVPRQDGDEHAVPESERRRQLVALAGASKDPRIYELAFLTCGRSAEDGCYALSARRWAELDAGNSVPLSFILDDAKARGDVSGQEEAWFHMATAARVNDRTLAQLQPIIASSNGSAGDQAAAEGLAMLAMGISAAWPLPVGRLYDCRPGALADANRAQLCARYANLMFEHSDSMTTRSYGATLIRRVGGDARPGAIVRSELEGWLQAWTPTKTLTCGELAGQLAFLSRAATDGGPAALHPVSSAAAP